MNPEQAPYATALASLPGVGPARLRVLLAAGTPRDVWDRLVAGRLAEDVEVVARLGARADALLSGWKSAGRAQEPEALQRRHDALGFRLLDADDADFPLALRQDIEPPSLLWVTGDISRIRTGVVAIVGTRRCTRYGHDVARRFGRELAESGVSVVSGLALGIDAAAHQGALEADGDAAPPVGVVGTGLDVVYPRRNRTLWETVADKGVLLSESPPGSLAEPWRFPARNRLIAALADLVIVVESTERGGSLYTVDEALARDVPVRVVPGPITSPASAGTNRLLADGAAPMLATDELLDSLGISTVRSEDQPEPSVYRDPDERTVLDVLTTGPATFDELAERSALSLDRLGLIVARLQVEGALVQSSGWYERGG